MSRKRRVYDDAFKRQCLAEVACGKSMAEVTRQYGLSKNSLYEWRVQVGPDSEPAGITSRELSALESQVKELERMVGRLSLENDLLKKYHELMSQEDKGSK
jgi:transposase